MTPAPTPSPLSPDVVGDVIERSVGAVPLRLADDVAAYAARVLDACAAAAQTPELVVPSDWMLTRSRLGVAVLASPLCPPPVLASADPPRSNLLRAALVSAFVDWLGIAPRPYNFARPDNLGPLPPAMPPAPRLAPTSAPRPVIPSSHPASRWSAADRGLLVAALCDVESEIVAESAGRRTPRVMVRLHVGDEGSANRLASLLAVSRPYHHTADLVRPYRVRVRGVKAEGVLREVLTALPPHRAADARRVLEQVAAAGSTA